MAKSKRSRPPSESKKPRPPSGFILYRVKCSKELRETYPSVPQRILSKWISEKWKREPDAVRYEYQNRSTLMYTEIRQNNPYWSCKRDDETNRSILSTNPRPRDVLEYLPYPMVSEKVVGGSSGASENEANFNMDDYINYSASP
ncbi:15663_t:CDS:1 [Acaulospora morrowiae]|uniref:15663_t:CDS:1 n=1 Tax=Acaulospora morrowiae TaxID=94023 RepID=A0A9N8Z0R5_9GLOM|nr:15663_t:CDS:1 [Acaulospora morrowiae]